MAINSWTGVSKLMRSTPIGRDKRAQSPDGPQGLGQKFWNQNNDAFLGNNQNHFNQMAGGCLFRPCRQ